MAIRRKGNSALTERLKKNSRNNYIKRLLEMDKSDFFEEYALGKNSINKKISEIQERGECQEEIKILFEHIEEYNQNEPEILRGLIQQYEGKLGEEEKQYELLESEGKELKSHNDNLLKELIAVHSERKRLVGKVPTKVVEVEGLVPDYESLTPEEKERFYESDTMLKAKMDDIVRKKEEIQSQINGVEEKKEAIRSTIDILNKRLETLKVRLQIAEKRRANKKKNSESAEKSSLEPELGQGYGTSVEQWKATCRKFGEESSPLAQEKAMGAISETIRKREGIGEKGESR